MVCTSCAGSHVAASGREMVVSGMRGGCPLESSYIAPRVTEHACLGNNMDYKPLISVPCNSLTIKW